VTGGAAGAALVCPDKFRGTLTAAQAATAMVRGLERAGYEDITACPLADGGEGTIDAIHASLGGGLRFATVTGPLGDPVDARWLVLPDGTALIEMASASGLGLVANHNDPLRASTRGTGELIRAALRGGARRIVVAVGGSATTDGGLGAVDALGHSLTGVDVTVACDVTTLFVDAARIFGPQKGASPAQVSLLERRLEHVAQEYVTRYGIDVRELDGSGAAGGLAGGLAALGATIEPGFEAVARLTGFEAALERARLVVTGEGKFDITSFSGKVCGSVLDWANEIGTYRRVVIAGQVTDAAREEATTYPDTLVLALTDRVWQAGQAFAEAPTLTEEAALEAGRWARGVDTGVDAPE
jgi:glycerate kinase